MALPMARALAEADRRVAAKQLQVLQDKLVRQEQFIAQRLEAHPKTVRDIQKWRQKREELEDKVSKLDRRLRLKEEMASPVTGKSPVLRSPTPKKNRRDTLKRRITAKSLEVGTEEATSPRLFSSKRGRKGPSNESGGSDDEGHGSIRFPQKPRPTIVRKDSSFDLLLTTTSPLPDARPLLQRRFSFAVGSPVADLKKARNPYAPPLTLPRFADDTGDVPFLASPRKQDLFNKFDRRIQMRILSFLGIRGACLMAQVNKAWKWRSSQDKLWKEFSWRTFQDAPTKLLPNISWRQWFDFRRQFLAVDPGHYHFRGSHC